MKKSSYREQSRQGRFARRAAARCIIDNPELPVYIVEFQKQIGYRLFSHHPESGCQCGEMWKSLIQSGWKIARVEDQTEIPFDPPFTLAPSYRVV